MRLYKDLVQFCEGLLKFHFVEVLWRCGEFPKILSQEEEEEEQDGPGV